MLRLGLGLLACLCLTAWAGADTLRVDNTDPEAFETIQEAWDMAGPGDTIEVYPGIDGYYYESLNLNGSTHPAGQKNGITIVAIGDVKLEALTLPGRITIANVQDFVFDGFEIGYYDAGGWYSHGIWVGSGDADNPCDNVTLRNLVIHDTGGIMEVRDWTGLQGEVHFLDSECYNNTFNESGDIKGTWWYAHECHMENIYSHDGGGSLGHFQTSYGRASHCVIRNCEVSGGHQGITAGSYDGAVDGGATRGSILIEGCTVSDIPQAPYVGQAISVGTTEADVTIRDCDVSYSGIGVEAGYNYDSNRFGPTGNTSPNIPFDGQLTIENCTFTECQWHGMIVQCGNVSMNHVNISMAPDPYSERGIYCHWNFRKIVYVNNDPAQGVEYSWSHPVNYSLSDVHVFGDYMETDVGIYVGAQNGAMDGGQTMGSIVLDNVSASNCKYHGIQTMVQEADVSISNATCELNGEQGLASNIWYDHHLYGPTGSLGLPIPAPGMLTLTNCALEFNGRAGLWCQSPNLRAEGVTTTVNGWQGFMCGQTWRDYVYVDDDPSKDLLYAFEPPLNAEVHNCTAIDNFTGGFSTGNCNRGVVIYSDCIAEHNGMGDGDWNGDGFAVSGTKYALIEDCISLDAGLPESATPSIAIGFHCWDNYIITLRNCEAADAGAAGVWIEKTALGTMENVLVDRCGHNGSADNIWLSVGNIDLPDAAAPNGLRACLVNVTSVNCAGDSGAWIWGGQVEGTEYWAEVYIADSFFGYAPNTGIWNAEYANVYLSYSDVYGNGNADYGGQTENTYELAGMIHEDPMFDADYSLLPGSPCIGAGDPRDIDELESRADMGAIPYDDGAYPAWMNREDPENPGTRLWTYTIPNIGHAEFGIPYTPTDSADASDIIRYEPDPENPATWVQPYDVSNRLFMWDTVGKTYGLYPYEFQDLVVGQGYLYLYVVAGRRDMSELDPYYPGISPVLPGEIRIPSAGRAMIALGGGHSIDMMDMLVRNEATGEIRSSWEDAAAGPDAWVNWNWVWWNTEARAYDTVNLAPVDPWVSYHVWCFADDVTLFVPAR